MAAPKSLACTVIIAALWVAAPVLGADHRESPLISSAVDVRPGDVARLYVTAVDVHRTVEPGDAGKRDPQRMTVGFEIYAPEARTPDSGGVTRFKLSEIRTSVVMLAAGETVAVEFVSPASGAVIRPVVNTEKSSPLVFPQTLELSRGDQILAILTPSAPTHH